MPDAGMPGDCISGTVALLDATGDAGSLPSSFTLYLSASPNVYFSLDGGCQGSASSYEYVVPPGTTSVPFWAQLRFSGANTLTADDSPRTLSTAYLTIPVAPGPVTQVIFDKPSYQVYVGQQLSAYIGFADTNGNYSALNQPEALTLASADPDAGLIVGFQGCQQDAGPAQTTAYAGSSDINFCMTGPRGTYTAVVTSADYGSATATLNICPGPSSACSSGADCCPDLLCHNFSCCLPSGAYAHTIDCSDCCSHSCFVVNPPTCY